MVFLTLTVSFVLFIIAIKLYSKLTVGWDRSFTCLVGKTAIVTGANTGIGFYTALDFAKRGGRVILACRNPEKAEEARAKIVKLSGNPHIIVKLIDMTSFDSIRAFAKDFKESEERLDILVNNAGAGGLGNNITKDGHNLLVQVNYFGSFLLTHLLIDNLKKSAPSRVVNVSSVMHKFAKLDPDNLDHYPEVISFFGDITNYANSKLCNVAFTIELARRLDGTGVTTNCLHPGAVSTDIFRRFNNLQRAFFTVFALPFFKTSLEGAQTSIYLSVSPEVRNISGQYYVDCKESSLSREITQHNFVKKIWENTEKIVNLKPEEKIS